MSDLVFVLVVLVRVGVPLAIPRLPLPAIAAALVVDAVDQTVLAAVDAEPDNYQNYDKALDIYYLAIAYLSTIRNWTDRPAFLTAQILWYYRLIGVVAFEFSGERTLLLVFPNTFEYFFIAYEAIRLRWDPIRLPARAVYGLAAAIWIGIKLPQEYWIHIAQLDFTDALAEPAFAVAVAVGAVVVLAVAVRAWRRAPAPDWPPTPEVDARRTTVLFRPAQPLAVRYPLIDHPLVEKTLLSGLIVAVFSQVFAIEATVTQITVTCGFIVVVNAVVSELLRRRSHSWRSTATEFAGLLFINWGASAVYLAVRSQVEASIEVGPTVVLLGLFTLVLILYDRFRSLRLANTAVAERLDVTVSTPAG
ncbi:MAG: hypothetical protein AAGA93_23100 [Actinomycetota bacterium]